MRTTDTLTISLPPTMTKQMAMVRKEENRTLSELLREAWRQYFENRYPAETPTKSELIAIRKGRAAFKQGNYVTLDQLHHELDSRNRGTRKKKFTESS